MSKFSGAPLTVTFLRGRNEFYELRGSAVGAHSDEDLEKRMELLKKFQYCLDLCLEMSLFDDMEDDFDSIPTIDLKFFILYYFIGELYYEMPTKSMRIKYGHVCKAEQFFGNFLELIERYPKFLKSKELLDMMRRTAEEDKTLNPMKKRDEKIYRFKYAKVMKEQMIELGKRKLEIAHRQRRANDDKLEEALLDADDEECERDVTFCELRLGVCETLNKLPLLAQEKMIMEFGIRQQQSASTADKPTVVNYRNEEEYLQFSTSISNRLLHRQRVREKMFVRANAPTMTMDEWLAEEKANGTLYADGGGPSQGTSSSPNESQSNETAEVQNEAEQKKEREWADWKDDNPPDGNLNRNSGGKKPLRPQKRFGKP